MFFKTMLSLKSKIFKESCHLILQKFYFRKYQRLVQNIMSLAKEWQDGILQLEFYNIYIT
jgi:hypothetical protein